MSRIRSRFLASIAAIMLTLAGAFAAPSPASAKREDTYNYPFSRVWSTTIRLMRVDFECPITEKDRDEGYFFFEYPDKDKKYPGSVEFITFKENGVERVRVSVQVPTMPTYIESMVLDKLTRRLLEEYGAPKETPVAPPKSDSPDGPGNEPGSNPKPAAPKPVAKPGNQG